MCTWIAWALLGLPIAYLFQKKYNRGWGLSILGGMAFVIIGALITGFIIGVLNSS